jgi:putative ABC transport system substrate-binding protein
MFLKDILHAESTSARVCLGACRRRTGGVAMLALTLDLLVSPLTAKAQQTKVYRVGFLFQSSPPIPGSPPGSVTKSLQDLGYVEGQNIVFDRRWAEGDAERFPGLASELVALKPDVIVADTTPGALAAKRATETIPIVMINVTQPIATGLVASLAHPGGNLTGIADLGIEMAVKGLDLIHAVVPKATLIAVLMSDNPVHPYQLNAIQAAAKNIGITLLPVTVTSPNDFEAAFELMARRNAGAVINLDGPPFGTVQQRKKLAELAAKTRLPMMCAERQCAELGGLMSYSPAFLGRAVAMYIDKILKGSKPDDLPVMQPTTFEFVINLKTAKTLGLTIPQPLLQRANRLID